MARKRPKTEFEVPLLKEWPDPPETTEARQEMSWERPLTIAFGLTPKCHVAAVALGGVLGKKQQYVNV